MSAQFSTAGGLGRSGKFVRYGSGISPDHQVQFGQPSILRTDEAAKLRQDTRLVIPDTTLSAFDLQLPPVGSPAIGDGEVIEFVSVLGSVQPFTVVKAPADPSGTIDGSFDSVIVGPGEIIAFQKIDSNWRIVDGAVLPAGGGVGVYSNNVVLAEANGTAGFALGPLAVAPGTQIANGTFVQTIAAPDAFLTYSGGVYTVGAAGGGLYDIKAQVSVTATGPTSPQQVGLYIRKNGGSIPGNEGHSTSLTRDPVANNELALSVYATELLVAGDDIDLGLSSGAGADSVTVDQVTFTLTRK